MSPGSGLQAMCCTSIGIYLIIIHCNINKGTRFRRLTPLMDSLVAKVFSDVTFDDYDVCDASTSSATPTVMSPYSDASLTSSCCKGARRRVTEGCDEQDNMVRLCSLLGVAPTLQMSKVSQLMSMIIRCCYCRTYYLNP